MKYNQERQKIGRIAIGIFGEDIIIEGAYDSGGYFIQLTSPIVENDDLIRIKENGLNITSICVSRINTIAIRVKMDTKVV